MSDGCMPNNTNINCKFYGLRTRREVMRGWERGRKLNVYTSNQVKYSQIKMKI